MDLSKINDDILGEFLLKEGITEEELASSLEFMRKSAGVYTHEPVGVKEFIESEEFLNKRGAIWPKVMETLEEITIPGKYEEVLLTGSIGSAKTTIAIYGIAYLLYLLSCLKNPHLKYGLDPSTEILIVFQNITETKARTAYRRFRALIKDSPYFKQHFKFNNNIESELQFPNYIIVRPVGGNSISVLGENLYAACLDEVNFMEVVHESKKEADGKTYDQADELYNIASTRRKNRFMTDGGQTHGMLFLASSKRHPGQFTDRKAEEAKTNPKIYVYDKRSWEVKPEGSFSGDMFEVYIGDQSHQPMVIESEDDYQPYMKGNIDKIPVELRQEFLRDIHKALKDLAGKSTRVNNPFIVDNEKIYQCFGKCPSIFTREFCDFSETFAEPNEEIIKTLNRTIPRFAHIDLGLTNDSAGLGIGHVPGFAEINRPSEDITEILPVIKFDALLRIDPPKNGEINISYIRDLINKLREVYGVNIKWVSMDSYQSRDTLQILGRKGIITGLQSIDKTPEPMSMLKSAILDLRIVAPEHKTAKYEIAHLQVNELNGKVDHPPMGSSDVAQAMAGVVYGVSRQLEIWLEHDIPFESVNDFKERYMKTN